MAHNNDYTLLWAQPDNGLDFEEVRIALGETTLDAGRLCRSNNINKWAKWKPIRSSSIGYVTLANRIVAGHGFDVVRPLAWSVIQNNQLPDSFEYLKPRGEGGGSGGADEHYRKFDFLHIESDLSQINTHGYNVLAEPPIEWRLYWRGTNYGDTLRINTFYQSLQEVSIRAKYRIGNQTSMETAGNMEIPLDKLTFSTGSGSVGNVGSSFKLAATNYNGGSLYTVEAPKVLNVLQDQGDGVGFIIPLSSVFPGNWPQDADTGYSFYPRFKDKDTTTYWSAITNKPLRVIPYFFNPLEVLFNGGIAFYDGAPDSGGALLAQFTPNGNAVKITDNGQAGETKTWTSTNLYVRFYSIFVTNNDNAEISPYLNGVGGVMISWDGDRYSTGVTYNPNVPASYEAFTIQANGNYTIGGSGKYIDFSFGQQSLTFTSGGGTATDKRASMPCPVIRLTVSSGTYDYSSGQRLYYY
jgi:hypothetical protein